MPSNEFGSTTYRAGRDGVCTDSRAPAAMTSMPTRPIHMCEEYVPAAVRPRPPRHTAPAKRARLRRRRRSGSACIAEANLGSSAESCASSCSNVRNSCSDNGMVALHPFVTPHDAQLVRRVTHNVSCSTAARCTTGKVHHTLTFHARACRHGPPVPAHPTRLAGRTMPAPKRALARSIARSASRHPFSRSPSRICRDV